MQGKQNSVLLNAPAVTSSSTTCISYLVTDMQKKAETDLFRLQWTLGLWYIARIQRQCSDKVVCADKVGDGEDQV